MKIYNYSHSLKDICESDVPTVFLAGPTVRTHQSHLRSWRPDAIAEFNKQGFEGDIIIPEFHGGTLPENVRVFSWLPAWEHHGLSGCDAIMFWVPRTTEMIGLTTNHELGYWTANRREKVVYGRPNDALSIDYTDFMWYADAEQKGFEPARIETTLADTVKATIALIEKSRFRTNLPSTRRQQSAITVPSPFGPF